MEDLALHILDVVENSIRADAENITVLFTEKGDIGTLIIDDDGNGMDENEVKLALSPFYTSKEGKSFGLGLSLLAQAGEATGGGLKIRSRPEGGTRITVKFFIHHADMKPLGDIQDIIEMLCISHPAIKFGYSYIKQGE